MTVIFKNLIIDKKLADRLDGYSIYKCKTFIITQKYGMKRLTPYLDDLAIPFVTIFQGIGLVLYAPI